MSEPVTSDDPGIQFDRILCFEPLVRGSPSEVVGDIFRSLAPFMGGDPPIGTVAMPLVSTGDYRLSTARMLEPLLDAALHWMAIGFPLRRLKIVAHSESMAGELADAFIPLREKYREFGLPPSAADYEVFVSYAHADAKPAAALVVEELGRLRPGVRIFCDEMTLDPGAAWQQKIYEAIDASRHFLAVFSPAYVHSKVCVEEFNIALHRRRDTGQELLFPVYAYTAPLPSYMRALVNYEDCREGDAGKLRAACRRLVALL
jgi:hypothetical protein